jgi:hypothetical protein
MRKGVKIDGYTLFSPTVPHRAYISAKKHEGPSTIFNYLSVGAKKTRVN